MRDSFFKLSAKKDDFFCPTYIIILFNRALKDKKILLLPKTMKTHSLAARGHQS